MATTPNFDFDSAYQGIINERNKTRVVFINGILTSESGFADGKDANDKLTLTNHPNSIEFKPDLREFKPVYNPTSSSPFLPGNLGLLESLVTTYSSFHEKISPILFQPALDKWNAEVNFGSQEWLDNINAKILTALANSSPDMMSVITDSEASEVARFVNKYGDWGKFYQALENETIFPPQYTVNSSSVPNDLLESFAQFMSDAPSKASNSVNIGQGWVGDATNFLSTPEHSLIIVAHSQGNYFVEDALRSGLSSSDKNRLKVISVGSPTDYISPASTGFKISELYKNGDDPVTNLRLGGTQSNQGKLEHFLKKQRVIMSVGGVTALGEDHNLGKYLEREDVRKDLINSFNTFNPKGYYFSPLSSSGTDGSIYGDWVEENEISETFRGNEGNDVIRAKDGNDRLIGASGYDFLDGGEGTDTSDYSSSQSGINVWADKVAGSDVYKVHDGFGTEDVLGYIEIISGSNFNDTMTGGEYSDIFYGQAGNDLFWAQKGDDTFYGGTGNDTAYGGDDNDYLRGEEGSDDLRGENGNDTIYGGSENDFLYGGDGEDELRGEQGSDELRGEIGNDTLYGGSENDFLYGGDGEDELRGEQGDDELRGESGNDTLYGGSENDFLYGGDGEDELRG
ncbi:calcium-binding protein, partial [Microcoleus sp. LAD1_D1]